MVPGHDDDASTLPRRAHRLKYGKKLDINISISTPAYLHWTEWNSQWHKQYKSCFERLTLAGVLVMALACPKL